MKTESNKSAADNGYRGMHNGTVRGKGFENSRRNRKTHAQRKAQRVAHELARIKN